MRTACAPCWTAPDSRELVPPAFGTSPVTACQLPSTKHFRCFGLLLPPPPPIAMRPLQGGSTNYSGNRDKADLDNHCRQMNPQSTHSTRTTRAQARTRSEPPPAWALSATASEGINAAAVTVAVTRTVAAVGRQTGKLCGRCGSSGALTAYPHGYPRLLAVSPSITLLTGVPAGGLIHYAVLK